MKPPYKYFSVKKGCKKGAVAKWNHSTISGGFEILKSQYIVVKIHFATAPFLYAHILIHFY